MSAAKGLAGDDPNNQSHEQMLEIKELLKMLAESQVKQAESQAKLAESQAKLLEAQADTQQQIIEILSRSTNNTIANSNNHKQKVLEEDTTNNAKEEITLDPDPDGDDEDEQPDKPKDVYRAKFVFGKHDLLLEALREDKLEKATEYLRNNPEVIKEAITEELFTILHKAVTWNVKMTFVEEIIKLTTPDILEYKTSSSSGGDIALHIAAFRGYTEAVVSMVSKNSKLAQIRNDDGYTPLEIALLFVTPGQKAIVEYLYSVMKDGKPSQFMGNDGAKLLCYLIDANFYDIASCLVKRFPQLITEKSVTHKMCGLEFLVRKPLAFPSGTKLTWWQNRVYSLIPVEMNTCQSTEFTERDEEKPPKSSKETKAEEDSKVSSITDKRIRVPCLIRRVPCVMNVYNQKLVHKQAIALLKQILVGLRNANRLDDEIKTFFQDNPDIVKEAIKLGTTEFIMEFLEQFRFLVWHNMADQKPIEMAIAEKDVAIVNLICECGDLFEDKITLLSVIDNNENTILHHAAKLAPSAKLTLVSGVALQIQQELQWFKGVESMLKISYNARRNKEGYTAQAIFTKEHKELVKDGEEWMKDTSGSCMLVAALIATVAFAAAFTVPGGNISDTDSSKNGAPVFLGKTPFTVFAVADAFALFSSITSVLMFLAIYTSRYAEMDFLKSLPQKLIIGLTTLFISMSAILVAFCAALLIMVEDKSPLSLILISLFGCVPVTLFAWLQLPLFYEMVRSTYFGNHFEQHKYIDPRVQKITTKRKRI